MHSSPRKRLSLNKCMEVTNKAIGKLIEKTRDNHVVRIGLTGGGCAGMEYVFKFNEPLDNAESDTVFDYGLTSNPYPSYGMPPSTTLCVESMSHLKSSTPMKNPDAVAESQ